MEPKPCCGSVGIRHKKDCLTQTNNTMEQKPVETNEDKKRIEELERANQEMMKKIEILYAVADKGRVFNYENRNQEKKQKEFKLSTQDGKIMIGWRTAKDEEIFDPRTSTKVGETQIMEILWLDKEGNKSTETVNGYGNFTKIKYANRIVCREVKWSEDFAGNIVYDVSLPDGRIISLDSRFVN